MGGFFGAATKNDCITDVFFGTDYHSHLGTRRGGMTAYSEDNGSSWLGGIVGDSGDEYQNMAGRVIQFTRDRVEKELETLTERWLELSDKEG